MTVVWQIALDEWRYWRRSKLAASVLLIGLVLVAGSAFLTATQMIEASHERQHLQEEAENAFLSQPDRHPHRMVHYGHYAFRTPPPLGMIDPGVDAYTGNSIFLEGHRQNSAMFAERQASAGLAMFGSLSPALLLQTLAPLLLILIGYNTVTRERDARTLNQLIAQGVTPVQIMLGKGIALTGAALLMTAPLIAVSILVVAQGEALSVVLLFVVGYFLYLLLWCAATVLSSSLMPTPGGSLGALLAVWVVFAMLVPRISTTVAASAVDALGKIETDFAVTEALKKVGDGHNAADPAFKALLGNLLKQYNVDSVEALPVNFRGVVAGDAEAKLTGVLNQFAEERMQVEIDQASVARKFGWLSPVLGIREFSMRLAGVDLETHHRFLRETEKLRFDFVQFLNKAQAEQVTFADDMNRSSDPAAEKRTRVSAENWKMLQDFHFTPFPPSDRIAASTSPLVKILIWFAVLMVCCGTIGRRAL